MVDAEETYRRGSQARGIPDTGGLERRRRSCQSCLRRGRGRQAQQEESRNTLAWKAHTQTHRVTATGGGTGDIPDFSSTDLGILQPPFEPGGSAEEPANGEAKGEAEARAQ